MTEQKIEGSKEIEKSSWQVKSDEKEKKLIDASWERNIKTVLEERISSKNVATYILHVGRWWSS